MPDPSPITYSSVTIGRYAFVGAGAVVNRNVPDHGLAVGNPGKRIGWVRRCGERLSDDLECGVCWIIDSGESNMNPQTINIQEAGANFSNLIQTVVSGVEIITVPKGSAQSARPSQLTVTMDGGNF